MTRDEALRTIGANLDDLHRMSVRSVSIFGSVARDEATDASDVDLLVEFDEGARVGLFHFIEVKQFLERLLGCSVDLGTAETLKPRIRDRILQEAIRVA